MRGRSIFYTMANIMTDTLRNELKDNWLEIIFCISKMFNVHSLLYEATNCSMNTELNIRGLRIQYSFYPPHQEIFPLFTTFDSKERFSVGLYWFCLYLFEISANMNLGRIHLWICPLELTKYIPTSDCILFNLVSVKLQEHK